MLQRQPVQAKEHYGKEETALLLAIQAKKKNERTEKSRKKDSKAMHDYTSYHVVALYPYHQGKSPKHPSA